MGIVTFIFMGCNELNDPECSTAVWYVVYIVLIRWWTVGWTTALRHHQWILSASPVDLPGWGRHHCGLHCTAGCNKYSWVSLTRDWWVSCQNPSVWHLNFLWDRNVTKSSIMYPFQSSLLIKLKNEDKTWKVWSSGTSRKHLKPHEGNPTWAEIFQKRGE